MNKKMKIIIIGGVAAGMSAAAKLKRNKPEYEVIVYEKTDIVSFGACGLPYFVGGFFDNPNEMIARTSEQFKDSGIDLRTYHEVIEVNTEKKSILVKDIKNNKTFEDNYDQLMIATGATPIIPPIENVKLDNVLTLKSMNDGIKLKYILAKEEIKNIVIIGAGFIGIEVLEAAHRLKKNITMVQIEDRIMPNVFDHQITDILQEEIKKHNINLKLNEAVTKFIGTTKIEKVVTSKGNEIPADLVIIATGFRPNTSFIEDTNINMLSNGAIIVDEYGRTSIDDIYAAGDCASIKHLVTNNDVYVPLATGANKLGRIVGENLSGAHIKFPGSLNSSCIKVMNMEAVCTGLTESQAKKLGINYRTKFIKDYNQTTYYPGRNDIYVKLIYHAETKKILGGQIAGYKDAVQRGNVLAACIAGNMTTAQLGMLDLCYAPPFSRTWDVLNVAGNISK